MKMQKGQIRLELAGTQEYEVGMISNVGVGNTSAEVGNSSLDAGNYIYIPFRAITATIVGAYSWKATDFSKVEALMAATDFLVGKPAFKNHEMGSIESIIGVIDSAKWTEQNGSIPAGIDIVFKIDAGKHPHLASSLTCSPPEIQSCSITVDFDWSPSHTEGYKDIDGNFDMWDFMYDIGTIGKDGKMICRKVDKINEMYECSLVGFGADPYAKILDANGAPINPDRAGIVNLAKDGKAPFMFLKEDGVMSQDVFNQAITESYSKLRKSLDDTQKLEAQLGVAEELAKKHVSDIQLLRISGKEVQQQLSVVQLEKEELVATLSLAKEKAEKYDAQVVAQKAEVIRLYKVSEGAKASEAIISLIEKANEVELDAFSSQYGASVMHQFSATCKTCKSNHIEFRSSLQEDLASEITLSISDYNEKFKGQSMKL